MATTIIDIRILLQKAKKKERKQLAELLDMELPESRSSKGEARALASQLCWKYQTPVGYLTRDPTFDEICKEVAKALKHEDLDCDGISSWELLRRIVEAMFGGMLEEMEPKQRKELMLQIAEPDQVEELKKTQGHNIGKASAGGALVAINQLGGFATYKIAVIVANQAARALLGRGLTLAANAALTRSISIFLGPVGWLLLAWGMNDLLGTNYKRVIPAVLYIYSIHERLDS